MVRSMVHVKNAGYDTIELWYSNLPTWVRDTIQEALDDLSLHAYSIHLPKFLTAYEEKEFSDSVHSSFNLIETLGLKVAVLHLPEQDQITSSRWEKRYETLPSDEKWFIIEEENGTRIGQIMHIPKGCHFRIGYVVVPEKRGRGYGTEAVQILVDYLFLSRDIVRIEAEVSPENRASQRVLEKAGFAREGIIRKSVYARGTWHDGVIFSILREEWKEPHSYSIGN